MKIKIVGIHDHDNDNYVSNKQSLDQGIKIFVNWYKHYYK